MPHSKEILRKAARIIREAEQDLGQLSFGERTDLLADNMEELDTLDEIRDVLGELLELD